jgi:uncharacterized protein
MSSFRLSIINKNNLLLAEVELAKTFWQRSRGLMFRNQLAKNQTLWILNCNSIHTGFMCFPIDVVFVNKKMQVKRIIKNIRPWRLVLPVWGATSVFEFASPATNLDQIEIGDQLHVGA